ncbi:laccase-25-like isoform X1 [Paramuricea clavata]|uniref:Laccase-25-like isoform X1 n=1 Tax=Paramuricea clavata TaxID=317549 RepID=A0A6S7GJ27_PARCT|nr:laccase-25-like isoform X1 [Paramuricea clavata]
MEKSQREKDVLKKAARLQKDRAIELEKHVDSLKQRLDQELTEAKLNEDVWKDKETKYKREKTSYEARIDKLKGRVDELEKIIEHTESTAKVYLKFSVPLHRNDAWFFLKGLYTSCLISCPLINRQAIKEALNTKLQTQVDGFKERLKAEEERNFAKSNGKCLINGSYPGPTIIVRYRGIVAIDVYNTMDEYTSIHFHGMHQRSVPWIDGVGNITQYPIYQLMANLATIVNIFVISIDHHEMHVMATDGYLVKPFETDYLVVNVSERYDFILKAKEDVLSGSKFPIRIQLLAVLCNDNSKVAGESYGHGFLVEQMRPVLPERLIVQNGRCNDKYNPLVELNGHSYFIAKIGYPEYDESGRITVPKKDIKLLPCGHPTWSDGIPGGIVVDSTTVRKDTVIVPAGGYVVIHLLQNNPGWWFMYCHIDYHLNHGMAIAIGENPNMASIPPDPLYNVTEEFCFTLRTFLVRENSNGLPDQIIVAANNALLTLIL